MAKPKALRLIADRCPKDPSKIVHEDRCAFCEDRGTVYIVDRQTSPLKFTVMCKFAASRPATQSNRG